MLCACQSIATLPHLIVIIRESCCLLLRIAAIALLSLLTSLTSAANYLSDADRDYLSAHPVLNVGILNNSWLPYWGGLELAPQGIHHDYAMSFARELGIQIRYQGYDSIHEMLLGLKNKEVDMVIGFGKTPSRANDFLFSLPLYKNVRVIWLRDKALELEPLESLKWVCVEKTSYCEVLAERGYRNIITARNYQAAAQMILQGLADATISNYVSLSHFLSEKEVSQGKVLFDKSLGTQINRVLFNKEQRKLKSIIDKVILAEQRGLTRSRIHSKDIYFLNDQASLRLLFDEGREQVIRYTIEEETFPLSYRDRDGKVKGYVHDILDRISMRSVLEFEYVPAEGRDVLQMLEDGVVDLLPARNYQGVDQRDFLVTEPYANITFDMVESTADYQERNLAILDRTGNYYSYLDVNRNYRNVRVFRELKELLPQLESGKVSHALMNRDLIHQLLIDDHSDHFKPLADSLETEYVVKLAMVVRKDDPMFHDMLNSALKTFSAKEIDSIQSAYRKVMLHFGYDKQQVIIYSLIALCLALLIVLLFSLWSTRLKDSLRQSEKVVELSQHQISWLTKLLDTIPSMISISDSKGRLVLSNQAYQASFRQCRENGCIELESICSFLNLSEREQAEFEEIIQVPASECGMGERFYHVTRKAIIHDQMEMTHYLTLFSDISDLKQTELALRESNRAALQAVEARNQFLAVVSHELRTPIAAMLGLMEILSHRLSNSESQQLLDNAIRSAERLSLHVNDILDFSKIEASQLQLDIQEYRIIEELGPVLRSFEASAQLKGLQFNVDWQPTAYIDAQYDALRVNQIVSNLLSNAVKFTEVGQIKVAISCDEKALSIEIVDTGCGMTEAQLECIFQPFVQADTSITRRFGGTGLGMSIVKSLLDLMGGTIAFHSELEQGTKVSVWIPVKGCAYTSDIEVTHYLGASDLVMAWFEKWSTRRNVAHGVPKFVDWSLSPMDNLYPDLLLKQWLAHESNNVRLPNEQVTCQLQGRVLIVDDEPINRLLMQKQLKEIGITSVALADGEQAYRYLQQHAEGIDLLITDCHMPIMDGFELTAKTRSDILSFATKPIVGCTAEDSRIAAEKATSAGMDKVIYKPYSLAQLQRVLAHYLPEQVQQADTNANWLNEYQEEEREEMANVVIESFSFDIEQLEQEGADVAAIAHRVKGAAGALLLHELAALAKRVEQQKELEHVERNKQQLILSMQTVVEQANAWLASSKGE
ncbi:hybrid sensor histidine kinase/response regulator [Vibrio vulnificus]|uniref:hybrid sensor histidine kinase/response regulator n=1 Tax=Vibrio vulnificus TaxID=672 RepID=UPI0005065A72|nr:histidine kinase [Vibrio vulnificus]